MLKRLDSFNELLGRYEVVRNYALELMILHWLFNRFWLLCLFRYLFFIY